MTTPANTTRRAAIVGALVADAAALGLHWLYDQDRVRELGGLEPEFTETTASDFEGFPAYFAHAKKRVGDFSQYGEQAMVMLQSLAANSGAYQRADYQDRFSAVFGYGGDYVGYIDRPTRATLDNLARADAQALANTRHYFGADDEQLPAVAKLPPLIALDPDATELGSRVESAVRVTNHNDLAVEAGRCYQALLQQALASRDLPAACKAVLDASGTTFRPLLESMQTRLDEPSVDVIRDIGMSCQLVYGLPGAVHILLTSDSYAQAARLNILAGGDSCGRAMVIGAVAGAVYGFDKKAGIPQAWIDRLNRKSELDALLSSVEL